MKASAVIAHAGKTLGGGLPELPARPRGRRTSRTSSGPRMPKSRARPRLELRRPPKQGAELEAVRLGRRRDGASAASTCSPGSSANLAFAIIPAGIREPVLRDEPRDPGRTSPTRSRWGFAASGVSSSSTSAASTASDSARRWRAQGFGRGEDQGRRDAQGSSRAARLRSERLAEPVAQTVRCPDHDRRSDVVQYR